MNNLFFVVHIRAGKLSPAIYTAQAGQFLGCCDPIVYSHSLSEEAASRGTAYLFKQYLAACELGALPASESPNQRS
jgi:hypothetical protein